VAVDGGPGDAELGGDLGDGVHTAPVGPSLLVHLLRDPRLAWGELRFLPAGAAAALLSRHGIPAGAARNTAMLALAADLPAPILASLVGISPSTADDWSRLARTDWTSYLAARDEPQDEINE
jgi:hypothetical protein